MRRIAGSRHRPSISKAQIPLVRFVVNFVVVQQVLANGTTS